MLALQDGIEIHRDRRNGGIAARIALRHHAVAGEHLDPETQPVGGRVAAIAQVAIGGGEVVGRRFELPIGVGQAEGGVQGGVAHHGFPSLDGVADAPAQILDPPIKLGRKVDIVSKQRARIHARPPIVQWRGFNTLAIRG